jgi:hypothetical protein
MAPVPRPYYNSNYHNCILHSIPMVPLHFCYQFYACLGVLTLFGGVSVLALALMTLYEVGGVEIVFALCLACLYGLLTLLLPPWPSARHFNEEVVLSHAEIAAAHLYIQQHQEQEHQEQVPEHFQPQQPLQFQQPIPSQWRMGGRSKRRQQRRLAIDTYQLEAKNGCHAKLLLPSNSSSCCPICLHNFAEGDRVTEGRHCKHVFHHDCLAIWLCKSPSCPYCRHDLEVSDSEDADKLEESHKTGIWGIFDGVLDSIYT